MLTKEYIHFLLGFFWCNYDTRCQEFANYITKVSQLENDSNYQNAEQVEAAIQKVIGSAPGVLDTLEEIGKSRGLNVSPFFLDGIQCMPYTR